MGVAFKKTCISDKIILIILISFQNITKSLGIFTKICETTSIYRANHSSRWSNPDAWRVRNLDL